MQDLEPKFVEAFVEAARSTFETMAMMDMNVDTVVPSVEAPSGYEVFTTIGLSGQSEGLLAIGSDRKFCAEFVSAMLGMEASELSDDEITDGAGELANMIAGGAKATLSNEGWAFDLALPVVLSGGGSEKLHLAASVGAWIRVTVDQFDVSIFVWMRG